MVRGGQPGVSLFDPLVHKMGIVDWTFDLTLNIGVTLAIAARLWYMGRTVSDYVSSGTGIGSRGNKYNKVIFTIIESGALFAIATLVTVSLYLSGNIATVVAIDSITQLAVSTPSRHVGVCVLRNTDGDCPDHHPAADRSPCRLGPDSRLDVRRSQRRVYDCARNWPVDLHHWRSHDLRAPPGTDQRI